MNNPSVFTITPAALGLIRSRGGSAVIEANRPVAAG